MLVVNYPWSITKRGAPVSRTLGGEEDGAVTYDRFRRFALLVPAQQMANLDPGRAWFEAATMMPLGAQSLLCLEAHLSAGRRVLQWSMADVMTSVLAKCAMIGQVSPCVGKSQNKMMFLQTRPDPVVHLTFARVCRLGRPADMLEEADKKGPNYLTVLAKAALAGGLASSVSVLTLHPIDTLKTRVQSTAGATFGSIARSAPAIGVRGLYRGIIPAVGGAKLPLHSFHLHLHVCTEPRVIHYSRFTCMLGDDASRVEHD